MVCLVVMLIMNLWSGSNKRHIRYLPNARNMAADQQPILAAAVSLRDMIEMTTSGSGSGVCYNYLIINSVLYFLI